MQHIEEFQTFVHAAESQPGSMVEMPMQILEAFSKLRSRADGNCLWYSLLSAILIDQELPISEIRDRDSTGELQRLARRLRRAICDELWDGDSMNFKSRYKDFWAPGEEGTEGANTPLTYIELLTKGQIFGGELELFAAASLLEQSIVVVNVPCSAAATTAHLVSIQPINKSSSKSLLLVRSGLHFDALYANASRLKQCQLVSL
jgi:hypothetical protein